MTPGKWRWWLLLVALGCARTAPPADTVELLWHPTYGVEDKGVLCHADELAWAAEAEDCRSCLCPPGTRGRVRFDGQTTGPSRERRRTEWCEYHARYLGPGCIIRHGLFLRVSGYLPWEDQVTVGQFHRGLAHSTWHEWHWNEGLGLHAAWRQYRFEAGALVAHSSIHFWTEPPASPVPPGPPPEPDRRVIRLPHGP